MTIRCAIALLTLTVLAGCGLLPESSAPTECGFDDVETAWVGTASLAQLELPPVPEFPNDRRGEIFVAELDEAGMRGYCIILDRDSPDQWAHSGEAPEGWNPPGRPSSTDALPGATGSDPSGGSK